MKIKTRLFAFCMLLAAAVGATWAAPVLSRQSPVISVEAVQMPAWVEHASGAREALEIGMRLVNTDRIYTGPGSRALLVLAGGSTVKLGENAILALDDMDRKKGGTGAITTATLDVTKGALRFTTNALSKMQGDLDVKVRISTIIAGIRGTDLWAKADAARDVLCLIEGKVTVVRGEQAFTMDEPMAFYVAAKNQPGQPVAKVPPQQLEAWKLETEIVAGRGAVRKGGQWRLYLGEAVTQDEALKLYDDLRAAGYAAEIRPLQQETGMIFRVRISKLHSRQDAMALGAALTGKFGVSSPRVSK